MSLKISAQLNYVIPVQKLDGTVIYVHQQPLMRETFERYYRVLAATYGEIMAGGVGMMVSGPRVAALELRAQARQRTVLGEDDVEEGLLREIRRLSNVIALDPEKGWRPIPVDLALKQNLLDEDDWAEAEGVAVFFIVTSAMQRREKIRGHLEMSARAWNAQVSSSTPMEFASSLTTSTAESASSESPKP